MKPAGGRRHSGTERDPADRHRLLLDLVATRPLERTGHAGAHPEPVVRGIRDRIRLDPGDVALPNLELQH